MGKHYSPLQPESRLQLYELLFQGAPIADIAEQLGFHRATIYREPERNSSSQVIDLIELTNST